MRLAALALGVAMLGCGALGCSGWGISLDEIPEEPILIVYRTRDEAQQRGEAVAKAKGKGESRRRAGEAHVALDDAALAFGVGKSVAERRLAFLGRMAILRPRTSEVEVLDFVRRGARPYDRRGNEQLMFMSTRTGAAQLYEWNAASGRIHALTSGPEGHPTGCYGPDGRLAYSEVTGTGATTKSRIMVTNPGGAAPRAVSPGPGDAKPIWSPDGRVLIYESRAPSGAISLYALDPDAEEPVPQRIANGRDADFSPDGQLIVYSAKVRGGWRLYRMLPNGTGKRAIGKRTRDESDPTFSPDGRYVVYVFDNHHLEQLRIRALDGSGDRPLLLDGDGVSPIW